VTGQGHRQRQLARMQEERFTIRQNNLAAHHAIQCSADFRFRPSGQ
jgi:hypothetical protein